MILYKYQAAGNDFVLIYMPDEKEEFTAERIIKLCDRRLGVGSDGLIIMEKSWEHAFSMKYYNNDGSCGMMCGNGGRCVVDFAQKAGILPNPESGDPEGTYVFDAPDGIHKGRIVKQENACKSVVELLMGDVANVEKLILPGNGESRIDAWKMNTGAEHLVFFRDDISSIDMAAEGSRWRYDRRFGPKGTNVDFVKTEDRNHIIVRTYEKGVEAETLSCGTGVIASAIAAYIKGDCYSDSIVRTTFNTFRVSFRNEGDKFADIRLTGDTELVFKAEYPSDRIF